MVRAIKLSGGAQENEMLPSKTRDQSLEPPHAVSFIRTEICQWRGFARESGDSLHISEGLPFLIAKLERGASALHAIPGKIQNRPDFHHSFPSSIHPAQPTDR